MIVNVTFPICQVHANNIVTVLHSCETSKLNTHLLMEPSLWSVGQWTPQGWGPCILSSFEPCCQTWDLDMSNSIILEVVSTHNIISLRCRKCSWFLTLSPLATLRSLVHIKKELQTKHLFLPTQSAQGIIVTPEPRMTNHFCVSTIINWLWLPRSWEWEGFWGHIWFQWEEDVDQLVARPLVASKKWYYLGYAFSIPFVSELFWQ